MSAKLRTYLIRSGISIHDVDDVLQEVELRIWKSADLIHADTSPIAWYYTIARNERNRWLAKRRLSQRDPLYVEKSSEASPLDLLQRDEEILAMRARLEKLPGDLREVVILKFYQNLSFSEVAEVLNKPVSTVKSQMIKALRTLQEGSK